ncbi:MAG: PaaI family thioesterase [Burkholderiaceae bacterium]
MAFTPLDPFFERRVRASFARQAAMGLIGATMSAVEPGGYAVKLPIRADLARQHRFLHGGIVGMIADGAGATRSTDRSDAADADRHARRKRRAARLTRRTVWTCQD